MKRIGLLGGMSWESSIEYERLINEEVRRRLGGVHSADLVVRSYDFAVVEALQARGAWSEAAALLAADARTLEAAGAGLIVLCTNTMHEVADAIEAAIRVPFVHIADATAAAVRARGLERVALLGTRYTMERAFYRGRLEARHGLTVLVPDEPDRTIVHDVIYEELVRGERRPESRRRYLEVIARLVAAGAQGVVAGCTEIELLVRSEDVSVPWFPTTRLHALAAVDAAFLDRRHACARPGDVSSKDPVPAGEHGRRRPSRHEAGDPSGRGTTMRDVFLALACTALGLAGCGGSVVVDGTGEGGSSGGSTSSSSSTTSGGGGSTVTTGGGAGSTGTETGTGTGTETTTTTSAPIACGDASCDGATQQCCASKDGASCISPGDPCQGFLLQCSSSASCNPGEVCCASFGNGPNDAEAKCTADCKGGPGPGGGVQLCATDAECQNGGTCEAGPGGFLTCHKGGGPGGGG